MSRERPDNDNTEEKPKGPRTPYPNVRAFAISPEASRITSPEDRPICRRCDFALRAPYHGHRDDTVRFQRPAMKLAGRVRSRI